MEIFITHQISEMQKKKKKRSANLTPTNSSFQIRYFWMFFLITLVHDVMESADYLW